MFSRILLCTVFLALALMASAANITVVMNGKTVSVPAVIANGKAYVDLVALMKLLGSNAVYTPAANKIVVGAAPAAPGGGGTAGTAQLPGDNGKLGDLYAMGKDRPLYFRLLSAEFTTTQVTMGDTLYVPKADEKLLLLRFTIQNPNKDETYVRWDSLKFTAVDAMNVNHECTSDWGDKESHNKVGISLKPAQKIEAYAVIEVPAKGVIPKLMVLPTDNSPVLRYALYDDKATPKSKVTPLPAPIADPADPTGATALGTVPGQVNTAYPYANFDITLEKNELISTALGENAPEEGGSFLVTTILMKNKAPNAIFTRWDTLGPVLTSTDGEELEYKNMLFATANREFAQDIKAGAEVRVRLYFNVPKDVMPKTLTLKEGESRSYTFEITK